jgi:uncharacterized protein
MMNELLMRALQAAALWSGLLILLLLVLAGVVSSGRRRHMVSLGDGGNPDLQAATRAFGNCAEYAPAGMAALILLALVGASPWMVHGVGGALLAGRVIHAVGLLFQTGPSLGRLVGMALTWIALLAAGVALVAFGVI